MHNCPQCREAEEREHRAWQNELMKELENDERLGEIVERIRADRVSKGLNPDTGLPVQP